LMFRERFNRYDGIVSLLPFPLSPLGSLSLASKRGGPIMSVSVDEVRDRQIPHLTGIRGLRLSTIHWC